MLQGKRRLEEEYLAYDTTSISSCSKLLKQVKYGVNKDHDPLAQINLALLFGDASRKLIKKELDKARTTMISRPHYSSKHGLYYDSFLVAWDYSEIKKRSGEIIKDSRRLYLHLYYNDQKATDDKKKNWCPRREGQSTKSSMANTTKSAKLP